MKPQKCKINDPTCVYHACMSEHCQKRHVLGNGANWGVGKCETNKPIPAGRPENMNNNKWTPDQPIRGLSFKQPFASLMLNGKTIETRTWSTNYRGWVLICSSKKEYNSEQVERIVGDQFMKVLTTFKPLPIPLGKAMAIGRLVDCRPFKPADSSAAMVEYQEGLFAHVYEDVYEILPFDFKGHQGWITHFNTPPGRFRLFKRINGYN